MLASQSITHIPSVGLAIQKCGYKNPLVYCPMFGQLVMFHMVTKTGDQLTIATQTKVGLAEYIHF